MIVVTFALAITQFIFDYRNVTQDGQDRAQAYAISMATDVGWYLGVAQQALKRVESQNIEFSSNPTDSLREALDDLPYGVGIVVYDTAGMSKLYLNRHANSINISDRDYFQQLQHGADWVISHVISDRLTGEKTFAVGRAMRRNGQFAGAIVAYAPMQVFNKAWLSVGGKDSNAFLVHADGGLSARLPETASEVFDAPLPKEFVERLFSADMGTYLADKSPIDGVRRAVGWARVEGFPLVAAIGISTEEVLQDFWIKLVTTLAVLLPISGLLGYVAIRNSRLIWEQEETSAALKDSLRKNEVLFREIHHRVKNNLQSVLSIVSLHSKSSNPVAEIRPRIQAMVAVHEQIYLNDQYVDVPAESYIPTIAQQIIDTTSDHVKLDTEIADITLPNSAVMPIGQLVTEAIINALKYGDQGTIRITLSPATDGMLVLSIHNKGEPLPEDKHTGMGTRLMQAFAGQLGGSVEMISEDGGFTVRATFPQPVAQD